ncbi:MAG: hypothetical protein D6805_01650 [Planctomycetota bacterium]|nr:MAG: hypothetical protein D6805_01650 [Planctomycetota bacterium]
MTDHTNPTPPQNPEQPNPQPPPTKEENPNPTPPNPTPPEKTTSTPPPFQIPKLIRISSICTILGLLCTSTFLLIGFNPWTMGLGFFLGVPFLALAILFYLIAVLQDLHKQGVL